MVITLGAKMNIYFTETRAEIRTVKLFQGNFA